MSMHARGTKNPAFQKSTHFALLEIIHDIFPRLYSSLFFSPERGFHISEEGLYYVAYYYTCILHRYQNTHEDMSGTNPFDIWAFMRVLHGVGDLDFSGKSVRWTIWLPECCWLVHSSVGGGLDWVDLSVSQGEVFISVAWRRRDLMFLFLSMFLSLSEVDTKTNVLLSGKGFPVS